MLSNHRIIYLLLSSSSSPWWRPPQRINIRSTTGIVEIYLERKVWILHTISLGYLTQLPLLLLLPLLLSHPAAAAMLCHARPQGPCGSFCVHRHHHTKLSVVSQKRAFFDKFWNNPIIQPFYLLPFSLAHLHRILVLCVRSFVDISPAKCLEIIIWRIGY